MGLSRAGEELCGDQVKVFQGDGKTIIVLSDGLGSGVKANILATLTTEIIVTMLKANASLADVLETVIGTLPICKIRRIAYATFTILQINSTTGEFELINFDNPAPFFFRQGRLLTLPVHREEILGRTIERTQGQLTRGDFIGIMSDGVEHAGMEITLDFGWGWDSVARHIEEVFRHNPHSARSIVRSVIARVHTLYQGDVGDDATFVGVLARERKSLIVFTGPPLDPDEDDRHAARVLGFEGRKVVCGGTTGNIVARYLDHPIDTDIDTLREDVPPIGYLPGIDLLTEGILTMSRALEYLRASRGSIAALPADRNGAVLLAKELLQADSVQFLVGQRINEFYQNPLLPRNISIRKSLVRELADFLRSLKKEVRIEYC
ncbi:MAG: serine/threonine protein phosphatase [Chloroflexi bacterium]|nr:MAG: serine/threonine protein phosphatase [Chloroflexota bacterium]